LWHGAGWTFIIWGGLHGIFLVINHFWRKTKIVLHNYIGWVITFFAVTITWVFFRADSVESALKMLKGMAGGYGISVPVSMPDFGLFIHSGIAPMSNVSGSFAGTGIIIALGIALLLPNLYEMTQKYQTALIGKKQYRVKLIQPIRFPLSYTISVRWCVIVGIIAAIGIISVQSTSEFLYFQF